MTKIKNNYRKRVLIINPFCKPNIGGAETLLEDYFEYLRKHNYYVYVQTYQPITTENVKGDPHEVKENLEIFRHRWIGHNLFHKLENYPFLNFFYMVPCLFVHSFLFMLKNEEKVDVVDANGFAAATIAWVLKLIFNKKTVVTVDSLYEFNKKPFYAKSVYFFIKNFNHVITESYKSKEEIVALGVPREKVTPFREWVDLTRFKPVDRKKLKEKLGWKDKFIVLFVGRAIPIKGADILLATAKKVNEKINFAFISGAGPQIEMLKKAGEEEKNVIFVGRIPYDQLHQYYQAADLFSIPSRYEENVARTMIEAISCGTPVVASNRGAIAQALDDKVSVLIDPTVENFTREIEKLFKDRKKLKKMQDNCRPYALKNFSAKNAQEIADCYDK